MTSAQTPASAWPEHVVAAVALVELEAAKPVVFFVAKEAYVSALVGAGLEATAVLAAGVAGSASAELAAEPDDEAVAESASADSFAAVE